MSKRRGEVVEAYRDWQARKQAVETLDELASKFGLTRQGLLKIVNKASEKKEAS